MSSHALASRRLTKAAQRRTLAKRRMNKIYLSACRTLMQIRLPPVDLAKLHESSAPTQELQRASTAADLAHSFMPAERWADRSAVAADRGIQLLSRANPPPKAWIATLKQGARCLVERWLGRRLDRDGSR